ncbi:unnamed protein product [Symbiodinium pilosum]|uniref:Methyltransferase domain-containing protein n=1 Tax=Symbiodinium pilosum TaxID=2952 RepID=A0A812KA10_SYMPI|nr:unnamed protein product [Symbiodinium pilosum]
MLRPVAVGLRGLSRYGSWGSENYDADVTKWGYKLPMLAVDYTRSVTSPTVFEGKKILDAGAGTGLLAQGLKDAGVKDATAIDISTELLSKAMKSGFYSCCKAVVREVTAALQLVPAPAAGGAPPAWAAPMVANVATLTANVATLTASNANQRRCSRNAAAIRRDVDGAGPQPVEMLCKELPGFGVLPAGALPPPVLAAHSPHPGPAVFPPPALHQPATTRISLTGQQISFLQCWYNDTFGIVAGDAVRAQRGAQLETLNFQVKGGAIELL